MRAEHLAIDGAVVSLEADADLSLGTTATGWCMVPSLMKAHPFASYPAGYSAVMERSVRANRTDVEFQSTEDYELKGGSLRVAQVAVPKESDATKRVTIGAWEGRTSCLVTSLRDAKPETLVEVFDSLDFEETTRGLTIKSPLLPRFRAPEVIKEVPGVGIVNVRPATSLEFDSVPKTRGAPTRHGELFRLRASADAVMLVAETAIVRIQPLPDGDRRQLMTMAEELRVDWVPPRAA